TITKTNCSKVSNASARNRLPIPAKLYSRAICSGVSMVSLSRRSKNDLQPVVKKAQAALDTAGKALARERQTRRAQSHARRTPRTRVALPPDGSRSFYLARRPQRRASCPLRQSAAGARPQYHL